MIHVIHSRATPTQLAEMLETLQGFVKLAVDIRRGVLAGGGILHSDGKGVLLEEGSKQEDIWGADWNPVTQEVTYEALINIRPRQNNASMEILDPAIRERVAHIAQELLGGV